LQQLGLLQFCGKFQTDCLEFRFAQYRRLAGTNYHVSVREIMESEKKLKLMSVLSLKSATFGRVSVSKFSKDCLSASAKEIEDVSIVADGFQVFCRVWRCQVYMMTTCVF